MGDRSPVCRLAVRNQPLGPNQPLPSAGCEMSTGERAVAVLYDLVGNCRSGIELAMRQTLRYVHLYGYRGLSIMVGL